ncbi:MAG: amidohydrolase [Flavobacteriales bacterium]|nr:amidohydrolase [Flavobacteriales bacterium]
MILSNRNIFSLLLCLISLSAVAQIPVPVDSQKQSILLLNGIAHIGNGKVIDRSAIGIRDGKLEYVLAAFDVRVDSTQFDTVIHIDKKHVYPGFIAPNSRLGLVEIGAVRASRDYDDVGEFNPHVRSLTAYNTESRITPTVRSNGVLFAQVSPTGGRISGSSSVFQLDGWNWEDAVIKSDDGIHLNWPRIRGWGDWSDEKKRKKNQEEYEAELRELKEFFDRAAAYAKKDYHLDVDLRMKAMSGLFLDSQRVYLHADRLNEITDAIYFFDAFPEIKVVLVGGYESWLAAELLKDRNIPVILRRVHSLPMNEDDDIHMPFKLPAMLHKKGLKVALENSGSMEAMGTRNLPFYAGTAIAYGLEAEVAISMLTLNTAEILGVTDRIGSLEAGKDASLFVSNGDALDMMSNELLFALVQGSFIDLDNPQKALYRKYRKKYKP